MPNVYPSLTELFAQRGDAEGRPYRVVVPNETQADNDEWFALSTSPAQAALAVLEHVGGSSERLGMREQNEAMMKTLAEQHRARHPDLFSKVEGEKAPDAYGELVVSLAEANTRPARAKVRERCKI